LKIKQQNGWRCTLVVRREKKKQKQITNCDDSTTILLHVPHHVEGETIAYPVRRRMSRFGHRVASHVSPEWRGLHPLAGSFGIHANIFFNKKFEKKTWKISKHSHEPVNYTKYQCENTKITPKTKLIFFVFYKIKNVFSMYMDRKKNHKHPCPAA
jgi:hypothetical protein